MFKMLYNKKLKYKVLLGFLIGIGIAIFTVLIMLTPVGSSVLKNIVESKIDRYVPGVEITYLDYGVNNFSLVAKKGHNIIKIYGAIFPFNAMFEGNIEKLSEIVPHFRGKMNLSGKIYTNRDKIIIDGMSFFANGYMNFKVNMDDNVDFEAKGSDFNLKKILYMLDINYPWVTGQTDMMIYKSGPLYQIVFKTSGKYEKNITTDFKAITKVNIKNSDISLDSVIKSDIAKISLSGKEFNRDWELKVNAHNVDLSRLTPLLLYPFKKKIDLKGLYETSNGVFKFKGKNFQGFADSKFEITFKMSGKEFFNYLGIINLLNGNVSGTVKIDKRVGSFDIVSNNTEFVKNSFTKRIYRLTGIDLSKENTGKVFFKGVFNQRRVLFDMLSTNQNISISVKKGRFIYPDRYNVILYLRKGNNVFKILLTEGNVKMLEKRDFRETDNKILVF